MQSEQSESKKCRPPKTRAIALVLVVGNPSTQLLQYWTLKVNYCKNPFRAIRVARGSKTHFEQSESPEQSESTANLRTNKIFRHFRDIPAKSRDIPRKVWFPWVTYRTFWPPPFQVEEPHPTRRYPDQKFAFGFLFLPREIKKDGQNHISIVSKKCSTNLCISSFS